MDSYVAFFELYREAGKSIKKVCSCRWPLDTKNNFESYTIKLHEAGATQPGLMCICSFEASLSRTAWPSRPAGSRTVGQSKIYQSVHLLSSHKCPATLSQLQSFLAQRLMMSPGLASQRLQWSWWLERMATQASAPPSAIWRMYACKPYISASVQEPPFHVLAARLPKVTPLASIHTNPPTHRCMSCVLSIPHNRLLN